MSQSINKEILYEKYERLGFFIERLKKMNELFERAEDAHNYMRKCLAYTEAEYVPPHKYKMSLEIFKGFWYDEKLRIYFYVPMHDKHMIIIHKNGAYAIYSCEGISLINLRNPRTYHKREAIIKFDSKYGQDLWSCIVEE